MEYQISQYQWNIQTDFQMTCILVFVSKFPHLHSIFNKHLKWKWKMENTENWRWVKVSADISNWIWTFLKLSADGCVLIERGLWSIGYFWNWLRIDRWSRFKQVVGTGRSSDKCHHQKLSSGVTTIFRIHFFVICHFLLPFMFLNISLSSSLSASASYSSSSSSSSSSS